MATANATVNLYDRNTVTPVRATTTTDANGWWTISHATQGRFDVEVVNGTSKRRRKYDTREQLEYLEVANFRVRNPADTFEYDIVPAAITAARQLNLPLITGTDTLMTLGLAQTVTGVLTLTTPAIGDATGTSLVLTGNLSAEDLLIEDSDASHYLTITTTSNLTAARTLTIVPGDASRTITLSGDTTLSGTNTGDVTLAGTPNYITLANQVLTLTKLDPADDLNTFASSVLAALVTDETGSGALVFGTAPTIAGGAHTALTGLGIRSTGTGAFDMTIANAENLAAGRTLTIQLGDAARTLILGASPSLSGTNTGDQTITLTGDVTGSGTGSFAATIANDAVTLAKMANMATGSLLGRNTAATGDPEVITDIPTAITIGSAYVYRVSGTDVALADGGTAASLTDPNADRIMFWDDSAGVVTWLSAGSGLTISGTEITASGAAATPVMLSSWHYFDAAAFTNNSTSGGTISHAAGQGALLTTSATISSGQRNWIRIAGDGSNSNQPELGSPTCSTQIVLNTVGTDFTTLHGIGIATATGAAIGYTVNHAGFKIVRAGSGTVDLFATQANGTTETASASLTTVAAADLLDLAFKINSTTSIDYYWRKNGGAQSSATNLATNLPSAASNAFSQQITNAGVATDSAFTAVYGSYQR